MLEESSSQIGSKSDYEYIRNLILTKAGIYLSEEKESMITSRINKKLKQYNLQSAQEYIQFLEQNPDELEFFINALTTNKTFFFRENEHFEFLKNTYFPELIKNIARDKTQFIWSGACSKGDEVYTLAMLFEEFVEKNPDFDYKILGTDIDTEILNTASKGVYIKESLEEVPPQYMKYFMKGKAERAGFYKISNTLKDHIKFRQYNLIESQKMGIKFNLIFLRNVLIYFQKETIQKVIETMTYHLKPGGYLFIGHCESLNHIEHDLEYISPALYQKKL